MQYESDTLISNTLISTFYLFFIRSELKFRVFKKHLRLYLVPESIKDEKKPIIRK